eukprot:3331918-Pyramimonas_sp.AAC.1
MSALWGMGPHLSGPSVHRRTACIPTALESSGSCPAWFQILTHTEMKTSAALSLHAAFVLS